jgi:rod shape-determining protein MreC
MNRTGRANRRIWLTVMVGAGVVAAGCLGMLGPLRWAFNHSVVPAGGGLASLGTNVSEAVGNIGGVRNLAKDNAQLAEENANLRRRLAEDAEIRRDNQLLRKQLGLDVAGAPAEVAAEVIAFQPDSYRQFVTINKGSKAGLKTGMAVLSQGMVMGTIADVQTNTARVMLVTDPEFSLTAKDQDTNATGIVRGRLGSGLVIDDVAQSDSVKAGDTVTTSGLGGVVPAGLLIGQLESVNTRANAVFQSGDVQTSLKVNSLRFAFVVLGP